MDITFIIAECGVNWRSLSEADKMIKAAAKAGADACKFQAYNSEQAQIAGISDHLEKIRLMPVDIRYLYYRCEQCGIEFMCTPMYPEAVEMLDPYVNRWKVRFADRNNYDIWIKCIDTDKEILVSDDHPLSGISDKTTKVEKVLFCVPEYPPKEYPLIPSGFDGYSCHIPDINYIAEAVKARNLEYLEVHVRLDTYDPAWEPIDQRVSIRMSELRQLCEELGK